MSGSRIIKRNEYIYGDTKAEIDNSLENSKEYHSKYGNNDPINWKAKYNPPKNNDDPVLNSIASDIIAINNSSKGSVEDLFSMSEEELKKQNEEFPTTESQLEIAKEESKVRKSK